MGFTSSNALSFFNLHFENLLLLYFANVWVLLSHLLLTDFAAQALPSSHACISGPALRSL